MESARIALAALVAGLLLAPFHAGASDIDIYSGLGAATGAPNLLIVMDNAGNFTSNYGGSTPCGYVDSGTAPGLAGTNGSIEQCAINNVIATLPVNADGSARINVGIMVYTSSTLTAAFPGCSSSGNGGCLIYPMTPMTKTNQANLMAFVKSWALASASTGVKISSNNEATAATMEEAWAYYAGKTGPSGTTYTSPVSTSGCQRNYVVFVANAVDTNGTPGDGSGSTPGTDLAGIVTADSLLTSAQKALYAPTTIQVTSGTYGISGVYSCAPNPYVMPSHTASSGLYADEWARFMYGTDLVTGGMPANKNIITYGIGVLSNACRADYPALLTSMANNGGGKFYAVQNADDLANALNSILNEVQAINSVFSSATLPVSVNTQGTYLNQIYMGMFRPDPNANPRWVGNVKQYQFAVDQNLNLFLADATGQPAISASGTGFISPEAASFWTCTNATQSAKLSGPPAPYLAYNTLPLCPADPDTGFWINYPDYANFSAGLAFDLMDGEIVEKGGAGQQVRLENLNDDYTTAAGTSTNPRRMYTYCPSGSSCVANLTDASNAFTPTNTGIPATAFGGQSSVVLASLTQSGGLVTATTSSAHGWSSGQTVTISGATPADYNGKFSITVPSGSTNTFQYTIPEYPASPATGLYQVQAHQTSISVSGITRTFTSGANPSPNPNIETATVTTAVPHGYASGSTAVVTGGTGIDALYNGQYTITVPSGSTNTFTYPVTVSPTTPSANTYRVTLHNPAAIAIATASLAGSTATFTTSNAHNFVTGDFIQIANSSNTCMNTSGGYVTVTGNTTFTMSGITGCGGNKTSTGGTATPVATGQTINPGNITRTGTGATAIATATVTNSQFASGDLVDITLVSGTGGTEAQYVGTFTISCSNSGCTTFTYPVSTSPPYPGSGNFKVSGTTGSVAVTTLTRSGTTATAQLGAVLPAFTSGGQVDVFAQSGTTTPSTETGYVGTFTATCGSTCQTLTFGPIPITPTSPATGVITAVNPNQPPDMTKLVNWVRGEDNFGDETSLCPPGVATGTGNCPSTRVTIRPSVHGDTLHSRPIAVNYGGSIGVVVYYGTNDGVYHAINGNQTASIGTVPPGGELWGFIASDFYAKLERQRSNTPQILMPQTPPGILPKPQPKDYFIDGPTGLLQEIDGNGNNVRVNIYIGARRGGHMLYALDVKDPTQPKFLWKLDNSSANMAELGETWSLPKVAIVSGYNDAFGNPKPVIIMGAGYDDGSEDAEPPVSATPNGGGVDNGSDNYGRGIFVLDALNGQVIWQAHHYNMTPDDFPYYWNRIDPATTGGVGGTANSNGVGFQGAFCAGTPPTMVECNVASMNYSMPADITLIDQNLDGKIDRLYATDTGGNVWRVDLEPSSGITPDHWQITKLAELGCNWGPCDTELWVSPYPTAKNPADTQRKFFFPAEVIATTSHNNYDAVFVGSGDREHPTASSQSYAVVNRMYMLKDYNTTNDSVTQIYSITEDGAWLYVDTNHTNIPGSLADCTGGTCASAPAGLGITRTATGLSYDQLSTIQQGMGYYFTLNTGEKVVNAPLVVAGYVYFGTNQPAPASTTAECTSNLGTARGYQLAPFSAQYASVVFSGGGLPPSPVAGIVNMQVNGNTVALPFCVGCPAPLTGGSSPGGNNCANSSVGACKPHINVPATRRRDYWYQDNK